MIRADMIVALDGGRIVERGSHHELLARGGLYARLYYAQFAADRALAETSESALEEAR